MQRNRILTPLIIAGALAGYVAMSACKSSAENRNGNRPPPTTVMVTSVSASDVPIFTEFPAQTYARNTVEVRGRVEGYIDKWLFRPGQQVHAGDLLYVLDQRPYQAAVAQAQGNLSQSEADLD